MDEIERYKQIEKLARELAKDAVSVAQYSKFARLNNDAKFEDVLGHVEAAERVILNTRKLQEILNTKAVTNEAGAP